MTKTATHEPDFTYLDWPFFDEAHRELAKEVHQWAKANLSDMEVEPHCSTANVDGMCRTLVKRLGTAGLLKHCVPKLGPNGVAGVDTRAVSLIREILAQYCGLADFAFAMQGLGSGAISLAGDPALKERYLSGVASGKLIAAFALSESSAGSDVSGMKCTIQKKEDHFILNGEKTWISNGGIADFYVVFAREPDSNRSSGISAIVVDAGTPGLLIEERLDVIAPHPLARLRFEQCQVPSSNLVGTLGGGFKLAMQTLDIFRTSVGAAALGFAKKAFDEAVYRSINRPMFGGYLADMQLTRSTLSDMATSIDYSALLVYRAAWSKDKGLNITREAAMAKMTSTEEAQRVIDSAVQLWGASGVLSGSTVERLYREIRALRIYEGATEVQRLIIGGDVIKQARRQLEQRDTTNQD